MYKPEFVNLLRIPGIESQPGGPVRQSYLTYSGPRQATLAGGIDSLESIMLLKHLQIRPLARQAKSAGEIDSLEIDSLESILGSLKV